MHRQIKLLHGWTIRDDEAYIREVLVAHKKTMFSFKTFKTKENCPMCVTTLDSAFNRKIQLENRFIQESELLLKKG